MVYRWSIRSVAAVALLVGSLVASAPGGAADSADADGEPRLPTVVNAPGTWSDDEGERGPVAAIGLADRTFPVGLLDARETVSYFATSALTGSSTWLDLPGFDLERWGLQGGVAVSPDGRWLGWVRTAKRHGIKGWSICDTTTGERRELDV